MKASLRTTLVVAGIALLWVPLRAQSPPDETGQGPQILTSDLARRQTVEKETLTASFLFVDEQPIVDIRINGDPQKFTQDTSVILSRQFDNRKEQQVIEVSATNLSGQTRQKSFLVINPTAVRRFGETVPKYYRIEDRWDAKWTPLTVSRAGAGAGVAGSVVYLIGGYSRIRYDYDTHRVLSKDGSSYLDSSESYHPAGKPESGSAAAKVGLQPHFLPGAGELLRDAPKMTSAPSAAVLDQKLYVFESRGKAYEFDPKQKQWRTFDNPIRLNRAGPAAAIGKRIYLFGGLFGVQTAGSPPRVSPSLQVWEFDPASGAFAIKRPLPTARGGAAACVVKGIAYVFGGYDGDRYLDAAEAYDPVTDGWSKVTPMPTPRAFPACVAVNDLIYVIGGRNRGVFGERVVGVMEMFDPATGIWRDRKPVPTPRSDLAAVAIEGVIYAIGGTDGSKPLSIVEAYR